MKPDNQHIIIVGAGLCGSLLALNLAKKGYRISLFEKRGDMRKELVDSGRSINLALSDRGLKALRLVGLEDRMRKECIPMRGRMIHSVAGDLRFSSYSGRERDYINSVSREDLNRILLEEADVHDHVNLHFNTTCTRIDFDSKTIFFNKDGEEINISGDLIIGTDGAGSRVRREMLAQIKDENKQDQSVFLTHGYKELEIPPAADGQWRIEKNALHIWPRGTFMLIALPNLDGSFTVTLFLPYEGENGFSDLDSDDKIIQFFERYFADAMPHMPDLIEDYHRNPTGKLGTLKCYPWQHNGQVVVMGDAAHAIVPFYGQGMNASFEDVVVFDSCLEEGSTWKEVLELFQHRRKADADAIADLALDNFYEMRDHVANESFIKKRQIEMDLEQKFTSYYSKYSMVTFKEDMPYSEAMEKGRKQDEILLELCASGAVDDMSLKDILDVVEHKV